jgi:hypothetical protein
VGGRSGPTIPPAEAGCTRRAATQWRTRASPGLRHAAAGSQGSDAHPPDRVPEAKRRHAQRRRPQPSARQRCPAPAEPTRAALSNPAGRRGGVRAGLCASRCRAFRPDRVCHADQQRIATPDGFIEVPSVRAHSMPRSFAPTRIDLRIGRPLSERPRDSRADSGEGPTDRPDHAGDIGRHKMSASEMEGPPTYTVEAAWRVWTHLGWSPLAPHDTIPILFVGSQTDQSRTMS